MPRKYKRSKKKISRKKRGGGRTTKAPPTKRPTKRTPTSTASKDQRPSMRSWMTKFKNILRRTTSPPFSLEVPKNTKVELDGVNIYVFEDMEPVKRGFTMAFNSSNYTLYEVSQIQDVINDEWNRETVGRNTVNGVDPLPPGWKTVNGFDGLTGDMT